MRQLKRVIPALFVLSYWRLGVPNLCYLNVEKTASAMSLRDKVFLDGKAFNESLQLIWL